MARLPVVPTERQSMKPDRNKRSAHRSPSTQRHAPARGREKGGSVRLYGLHAALAALTNPSRVIHAVHATPNAAQRIASTGAGERGVVHTVSPKDLDRMLGDTTVHQGILVEAAPLPEPGRELLDNARLVLVLDQITDPHNVGAILRSAAAFSVDALIMTARHSPPLQGVLAKAASGGLEHVPVMLPANLATALRELGEQGYFRIGLDSDADGPLEDLPMSDKLALVLGAEDRGLRRLTRENCDRPLRSIQWRLSVDKEKCRPYEAASPKRYRSS
ncbi:MAG: RNA methyltransferase [Alphaproteobacteria bacterium]